MNRAGPANRILQNDSKIFRFALIILLFIIILYLINRLFFPVDWVDATVGPLPTGTEEFYLVYEDTRGVQDALSWYHAKPFPFTMRASEEGGWFGFANESFAAASVQWKSCEKYGVLVRCRDGGWKLWWLKPREMTFPSSLRFLIGRGRAKMILPKEDRASQPSTELLNRIGFSTHGKP